MSFVSLFPFCSVFVRMLASISRFLNQASFTNMQGEMVKQIELVEETHAVEKGENAKRKAESRIPIEQDSFLSEPRHEDSIIAWTSCCRPPRKSASQARLSS